MHRLVRIEDPPALILGSRYDLSCDLVVSALRRKGRPYLRLNSEDLAQGTCCLFPTGGELRGECAGVEYRLRTESLRRVLFRRGVYPRDYGGDDSGSEEAFQRTQWAAFLRSLIVFDGARWMNHPQATYAAEHKAFQLRVAHDLGFAVPETFITNSQPYLDEKISADASIAVKGLDTVLVRTETTETFGFTTFFTFTELRQERFDDAPMVIQRAVTEKLDIRVTVVGERLFSAAITGPEGPIAGDWRTLKSQARFSPHALPAEVGDRCIGLVRRLGLAFGALDLAFGQGEYWFLEINPTGEWAWLVDATGLPIDGAIADWLSEAL